MNRVKKLVGGILAITLCVSVSAQTKLPPGWQSSYVKITPKGELTYYPDKQIRYRILAGLVIIMVINQFLIIR